MIGDGTSTKLAYFSSEKKGILILTLIGPLIRSNALILSECINVVSSSSARWIILNCRDIPPEIDQSLAAPLARLQKTIREKPAELRISGLHPDLFVTFKKKGILREHEICSNLAEALQQIAATAGDRKAA